MIEKGHKQTVSAVALEETVACPPRLQEQAVLAVGTPISSRMLRLHRV